MSLIKKMANVGAAAVGLLMAPVGLAAEIPLLVRNIKKGIEIDKVEAQSKYVCVLSEKLTNEMEQLNSVNLEIDNYVVISAQVDKQKHYEDIYNQAVNVLTEFQISAPISKEDFINYMLDNGEELERYINSAKFNDCLSSLKTILEDTTKSPEEKLNDIKLSIEDDEKFFSQKFVNNKIEFGVYIALIFCQLFGLSMSIGMILQAHDDGFFDKKFLSSAAMLLFGPLTGSTISEVIEK